MADFIAVIRRAVDGLSENTPEMRVKVYDRARSAVVRQLENMKPRPPETMFQRQLDKLDAAIREVEADYAEAQPPAPVEELAPQPPEQVWSEEQQEPELQAPEPVAAAPRPEDIPGQRDAAEFVSSEPTAVATTEADAAPSFVEEPAESSDDRSEEPPEAETVHPVSAEERPEEQAELSSPPADESPVTEHSAAEGERSPSGSVETPDAAYGDAPVTPEADWRADVVAAEPVFGRAASEAAPFVDAEPIDQESEPFTWPHYQEPTQTAAAPEPAPFETVQAEWPRTAVDDLPRTPAETAIPVDVATFAEPQDWAVAPDTREPEGRREPEMPRVVYDEADVVSGFNAFVQEEISRKVVPPPPSKRPPDEDFGWGAGFDDLPDLPRTEAFDEALRAKQDALDAAPDAQAKDKTARAELAELVGFDEMAALTSPDPEWVQTPPVSGKKGKKAAGRGAKAGKVRDRGGKAGRKLMPLVAGLAGVVALGGVAYAGWTYRDDLGKLIASITSSSEKPVATQAEKAVTPAKPAAQSTEAPAATAKPTEVASLDAGPQKFTQRLMPDGSETESDASKAIVDEALPEGQSVAAQTEKSKEVASADTAPAAAKPAATAVGVTQKMFLYEERLGQSTPSATPGTVSWSEKTEDDGDKPAPSIQAKVEAPGRKLTALITFKKNMDPSLPASHIVEIVFDLPAGFEEGNVESVQRIAFKQTEQDAGNPLIAVPAKVTDDYHMVALNSDAEAQKVNLDLMKNRGWIDIPITYRNGRRGLITLEKGATGTALFDKVIGEWSALGNQASAPQ